MVKFMNVTVTVSDKEMRAYGLLEHEALREYACRKLNKKVQELEQEFENQIELIKFDEFFEDKLELMHPSLSEIEGSNTIHVQYCTLSAYFTVYLTEEVK